MRIPQYIPEYPAPITMTLNGRKFSMGLSFSWKVEGRRGLGLGLGSDVTAITAIDEDGEEFYFQSRGLLSQTFALIYASEENHRVERQYRATGHLHNYVNYLAFLSDRIITE